MNGYVQDKVKPGTGREGALGYERYIAREHMDVRRDCVSLAQRKWMNGTPRAQDAQERCLSVLHDV